MARIFAVALLGVGLVAVPHASATSDNGVPNFNWPSMLCADIPRVVRTLISASQYALDEGIEAMQAGDEAGAQEAFDTVGELQSEALEGVEAYAEGDCKH